MANIFIEFDIDSKSKISKGFCCGFAIVDDIGDVNDIFQVHGKLFRILYKSACISDCKLQQYILDLTNGRENFFVYLFSNCGVQNGSNFEITPIININKKCESHDNINACIECIDTTKNSIETKTCIKCGHVKPLSEFKKQKDARKEIGYYIRGVCKLCCREYDRKYNESRRKNKTV